MSVSESEVHKLAKQMMLRDLRGHLNDWEEGKYTFLDLRDVHNNLWNIFVNWEHYLNAAELKVKPEQPPLIPDDTADRSGGRCMFDE